MLGLIGSSLGGLAKKVLKDRAVKIGKAVYERTLKPVIMKLGQGDRINATGDDEPSRRRLGDAPR